MTSAVKQWLAAQITQIDSVQKSVFSPDADIVVHSWRGILIHVHLVEEALKPRTLKRIAQDATRIGIGTLFVLNQKLLPPDGARLMPDEWLMAVHALTDDKIYAYREDERGPHVFQVHFKVTSKSEERDVWYGPDIRIEQLPFYRVWVKTPSSVKGDYLIANFAADPFWHNREYRAQRVAAEEQRRAERRAQYTTYEFGYGSMPSELVKRPKTKLEMSYATLGLNKGAPCDEVKAAFRRLALEMHPDVSALPKAEAETKFRALKDAYQFIRDSQECG